MRRPHDHCALASELQGEAFREPLSISGDTNTLPIFFRIPFVGSFGSSMQVWLSANNPVRLSVALAAAQPYANYTISQCINKSLRFC